MSQDEMSVFCDIMVSVFLSKKMYTYIFFKYFRQ
jgi:hypothetical protein